MYSVSIIGPGRVGKALFNSLPRSMYRVDWLVVRDKAAWLEQNRQFEGEANLVDIGDLDQIDSDIVLFTTQDSKIAEAVSEVGPLIKARCIAAHTSGSTSSSVLEPLRRDGVFIGSLHPLVSVRSTVSELNVFDGAYFCLEGDHEFTEVATKIVNDLGGIPFSIDTESKTLYHAAAVMACGHLVALIEASTRVMQQSIPDEAFARMILGPLIRSTIAGLHDGSFSQALTGPFARADSETISRHVTALQRLDDRRLLEIYAVLGLRSATIASGVSADANALDEIRRELMMAISNSE